ncbi:aspartyl protease family protein [Cellulophaga baltica]|uniref:aspartyl protease family protein n=1 Tax=Cellulophaga baltica TaxID=76594 RepID=UPI00041E76F8|nr:aspartyl protease family protein [Cellulophaga baltica]AIY13997.1 hypothetical protein M667_12700 [Cellulophaga baltica NN016038]
MKQILIFLFILSANISNAQEIIPFKLGDDNRLYINGFINQSDTLNLVFDLGANITVINKTRMKEKNINIKFDSLVSNGGTNGSSKEEISFNNQVILGTQTYSNIDVLGISYSEDDLLDGVIGWNFFKEKKIKINYESNEIVVFDNLSEIPNGYIKSKIKFINNLPYLKTVVYKGKKKAKIWAMLDIGYNGSLLVYYPAVSKHNLLNQYPLIGEGISHGTDGRIAKSDLVEIPKINLSGFEIYNIPVLLTKTKFESSIPALLGGNLLKRFNFILDFKKKRVYIKPNENINSEF